MKHKGHDLSGGGKGAPHYQTDGKYGHTFWQVAAVFGLNLLNPVDMIAGELCGDDTLYPDGYSDNYCE